MPMPQTNFTEQIFALDEALKLCERKKIEVISAAEIIILEAMKDEPNQSIIAKAAAKANASHQEVLKARKGIRQQYAAIKALSETDQHKLGDIESRVKLAEKYAHDASKNVHKAQRALKLVEAKVNHKQKNLASTITYQSDADRYSAAIKISKLDISEYILLSSALLKESLGDAVKIELLEIQQCYLRNEMVKAKDIIVKVCKQHQDNSYLSDILIRSDKPFADNPSKNYSRRYFETICSQEVWNTLDKNDFMSMQQVSSIIRSTNPNFKPPVNIDSLENAAKLIGVIRDFGDQTLEIEESRNIIKPKVELYNKKDRGKQKTDDKTYSSNPGVMLASQPNPRDQQTPITHNRIVDMFYIKQVEGGYSATHTTVPFVNSASGTVFSLVVTLDKLATTHKGNANLQVWIDSMVKSFLAFTCKEGYHSFGEMMDVATHPAVQEVLQKHGLKLNIDFPAQPVENAFQQTIDYTTNICLKRAVNDELISEQNSISFRI